MVPENPSIQLETLGAVPYILQEIQNDKPIIDKIIEDLNFIGYPVESVTSIGVPQMGIQKLIYG